MRLVIGGQVSFGSPAPPVRWPLDAQFLGLRMTYSTGVVRNSWRTTGVVKQVWELTTLHYIPEISYQGDPTYEGLPAGRVFSLGDLVDNRCITL